MDIFDDILTTLDLKGSLYFRTDFTAPWAVTVPQHVQAARFHLVIQGRCYVQIEAGPSVELGPGDLILIPAGKSHVLSSTSVKCAPPLETVLKDANYQGDGVLVVGEGDPDASTQLVCGHFNFRADADHPLIRALPNHILTSASSRAKHPLLDETLRLITRRVFTENLGSTAAISRLSEIIFIELLRSGITQHPAMQSILEAFRDPKIGQSLRLIHAQPDNAWTVETLANEVAMSRSRFADRFRELVGIAPMSYLSEWRLQKALTLLEDARNSVQQVAIQSGYQSPSAFSRAFQGKFGIPPKQYRSKAV